MENNYSWKRFPKVQDGPGRPTKNYRRSFLCYVLWDKEHGMTYDAIAKKYGVSKSTACRMVRFAREVEVEPKEGGNE